VRRRPQQRGWRPLLAGIETLRPRLTIAACAALGPFGLLGLAGAAGGFSDSLDILNHGTQVFFLAAVGLTVASLALTPRRRWVTLMGAICAVATGGILSQDRPPPTVKLEAGAPVLRIIEHNAWAKNRRPYQTAEAILARHADVVVLVEAEGSSRLVADRLRAAYPYATRCLDGPYCGMEIFSRYPISGWRSHIGGWRPPENDFLMWLRADIDAGQAGPVSLYATKLVHPGPNGVQARQIEGLVETLGLSGGRRTIVTGDFNLTPWSFRLRRLDGSLQQVAGLRRLTRGVRTWPARLPQAPGANWPVPLIGIDHLYAGPDWRLVSLKRLPATGSDHYPIEAVLTPRQ
jgi:endonuclease/exonuclease/phosphatase (EEP) superfamily protein YafD